MWPDTRLLDLFGVELPIVQAPMAAATGVEMAVAVAKAGGLGSLPCAMLTADKIRAGVAEIRSHRDRPINLNFFCHAARTGDVAHEQAWLKRLAPYYAALGATPPALPLKAGLQPFSEEACALVEELRPAVASFHFGLPAPDLLARVKAARCKVLSSATSVKEAIWLAERGVDAIIAQGAEAGGHRGMFLETDVAAQVGTFALVPQIADAVKIPVIAAGGIADARGVAAAFALGASGVQIGTAYLRCPEAHISELHRAALKKLDPATVITNVLTGRPARAIINRFIAEQGPVDPEAPAFPLATQAAIPLRTNAEKQGSGDFSSFWSGEARSLGRDMNAESLTRTIAEESLALLRSLAQVNGKR
jgi:nitronate monooxygenase